MNSILDHKLSEKVNQKSIFVHKHVCGKVDRQIGLISRTRSAARRNTSKDIKAELGDWRKEKEELNAKQRQEQLAKSEAEKAKLRRK